jgi:5-methylcytosine-specific restriction endonuclease McrA
MTGFSKQVRDLVLKRADGRCEKCGMFTDVLQLHHRRARGMGSTRRPESNQPSNAAAICPPCHTHIESRRADALFQGWLVRQEKSPAETPVFRWGQWVLLRDDGGVEVRA